MSKKSTTGLRLACVASRDNKPIGDKMIMNAAFLIQREREAEFDAAVNMIAKTFGDRLELQVHGPLAALQFREYPVEAGERHRKLMFVIDDLLMLPFTGFKSIMNTLIKVAQEEYTDDAPLKEQLLNLQVRLDQGEIGEEEYVAEEAHILRELREIQRHKRELSGADPEQQGLSGKVMEGSGASLTVAFHTPEEE